MAKQYGSQSMVEPLKHVMVKRPDKAFAVDNYTKWHYTSTPNLTIAQEEHDALVSLLIDAGAEVAYHEEHLPELADAIYVRDTSIVTDRGAVILRMGKPLRRGEEEAVARCYKKLGIPILYTLHDDARAEGGDLVWLDHNTLAVGQGFRTNQEGLRQLSDSLEALGATTIPVELPYFNGPAACLHLMSLISPVDHNLAVVYPPLMPVSFWKLLQNKGFEFVEVPDEEFLTMGTNVFALAPRKCIMLEGNPITLGRLERAGCTVQTYRGNEISLKSEGGVTCLTRPLLRM